MCWKYTKNYCTMRRVRDKVIQIGVEKKVAEGIPFDHHLDFI
jgi:hypothetical protein